MALSTANPRRPNTPATAQADRWWPRQSSGRPHRQLREDKERGNRRRRRSNTRKDWDENSVSREVGQHTNGLDESGPPWDRTRARCGGGNAGNASRKCSSSTVFDAKCCQPWRGWKGSPVSSGTGGRTPSTNSSQLGNTQPASAREATHSRATFMLAISPPPLSPCNMMPATCGCPLLNHGQAIRPNWPNERLHEIELRYAIPTRLCSGATTWWHSARMSPPAPREADSDTPERHGRAPSRTVRNQ